MGLELDGVRCGGGEPAQRSDQKGRRGEFHGVNCSDCNRIPGPSNI